MTEAPPSPGADEPAGHKHEVGADEGRDRAGRGSYRVHRHHLFARYHMRAATPTGRTRRTGKIRWRTALPSSSGMSPARTARIVPITATSTSRPRLAPTSTQPAIPAIHQRSGEWTQQRVGQEQHRERARDRHGSAARSGLNKQRSGQPRLEKPITELTRHADLQQSPEIGQIAHRPPKLTGCARLRPGLNHRTDFQDWGKRARGAPTEKTGAQPQYKYSWPALVCPGWCCGSAMMVGWRSPKTPKTRRTRRAAGASGHLVVG